MITSATFTRNLCKSKLSQNFGLMSTLNSFILGNEHDQLKLKIELQLDDKSCHHCHCKYVDGIKQYFLSWWKLTEIITLLFKTLAELQISAIKNQLKIIRKVISVQWRFPIASTLTEQLIHRSLLFWQLILRYRIQGNIRPFIFIFSFSSDLQSILGGWAGFIFHFF